MPSSPLSIENGDGFLLDRTVLSSRRAHYVPSFLGVIVPQFQVRNGHFWLMVFGVLASTFLSALTLSRHRSAFRKNRPYGWCVALVVSALQLAPLVEMVDKLGDGVCWGLREEETSPLQSVPGKVHR